MNSSDPTLTTAEEKLTAYLDGRLPAAEAAAYEKAHPEAAAERVQLDRMRATLAQRSPAPAMRHTEFFHRQILREISAHPSPATPTAKPEPSVFNLWRLVLGGAFCFLAAFGVYRSMAPAKTAAPEYFAEVISVKTDDKSLTARFVPTDGLAIVMIDGLEPMTEDFILN